jgi:hypothetical protein
MGDSSPTLSWLEVEVSLSLFNLPFFFQIKSWSARSMETS